jgi:hypothetical protein
VDADQAVSMMCSAENGQVSLTVQPLPQGGVGGFAHGGEVGEDGLGVYGIGETPLDGRMVRFH